MVAFSTARDISDWSILTLDSLEGCCSNSLTGEAWVSYQDLPLLLLTILLLLSPAAAVPAAICFFCKYDVLLLDNVADADNAHANVCPDQDSSETSATETRRKTPIPAWGE